MIVVCRFYACGLLIWSQNIGDVSHFSIWYFFSDLNSISRSGLFKYPSVQLQISSWFMKYFLVDRIYKICEDKVDLHEEKINYIEFQSKCGKICSLKFNLQPNWRFRLSQQPACLHRFLSDIKESQTKNKKDLVSGSICNEALHWYIDCLTCLSGVFNFSIIFLYCFLPQWRVYCVEN